jgi:DNA-binding transcriptional MerR regulator
VRSPTGQRHYSDSAVDRVRWIQALYAAGLSSKAITGLLPCVHTGIATEAMITQLAVERDRIDTQIRDLTTTRDRLDAIITAAANPGPDCAPSRATPASSTA